MTNREAINLLEEIKVNKAYTEAFEMALKALEAQEAWYDSHEYPHKEQWVPVSERLPEEQVDVLVTRHFHSDEELRKCGITENYYVEVSNRIDDEWFSDSDEFKLRIQLHEVVAWMPLPKPWEGEEDERIKNS